MEGLVRHTMLGASASARAQLIGSASRYITDNNFCNLLQNIDINNPKKFNYSIFAAFTAVPGLAAQVTNWVRSASANANVNVR
jgi:hypothetical protein